MSDTQRPVTGLLARARWINQAMGWAHVWKGADFTTGFAFRAWLRDRLDADDLTPWDDADINELWEQWMEAIA